MRYLAKILFAMAGPLLLTGCLWGPGKFKSELTLHRDGSFVLDYKGEIVLQVPKDEFKPTPWTDKQAYCFVGYNPPPPPIQVVPPVVIAPPAPPAPGKLTPPYAPPKRRDCTPSEIAQQKQAFEKNQATIAEKKRADAENMAKMFGVPGIDDASSREFAAKLMKFAGWRSVTYRGDGVFDVDYHFVGSAKQDFIFPALPGNDLLIPFIAVRRRADGSVLVTAPEFVGSTGPLGSRLAGLAGAKGSPISRAEGRFTVSTNGEILTNNSEDGPSSGPRGRQVHWDVNASSNKIPETLIRL